MIKSKFPFNVKPVLVEWIDSMGSGGWKHEVDMYNMNCVSVGILVGKTKDRITLALNANEQQRGDIIQIPMIAVKRIRKLKV